MRAHTTATSATEPLVIHCLAPFRTHDEPSRRAVVRIPAGFDPKSGSVSPKHPMALPEASAGSQRSFCSWEPNAQIGNITSELCTDTRLRSPESPRSSSCITRP